MTNIVGTIAIVLVTNATQIGTFHSDLGYGDYNVMEHKLFTNTVVMVEFEGGIKQFTLKSDPGPVLKEERIYRQPTNVFTNSIWWGNPIITNISPTILLDNAVNAR